MEFQSHIVVTSQSMNTKFVAPTPSWRYVIFPYVAIPNVIVPNVIIPKLRNNPERLAWAKP